jgi:hypothetical protein
LSAQFTAQFTAEEHLVGLPCEATFCSQRLQIVLVLLLLPTGGLGTGHQQYSAVQCSAVHSPLLLELGPAVGAFDHWEVTTAFLRQGVRQAQVSSFSYIKEKDYATFVSSSSQTCGGYVKHCKLVKGS